MTSFAKAIGLAALAMMFAVGMTAFAADEITGTVADTDGKPVADAQVYVCRMTDSFTHFEKVAEGRSGADGAFKISLPEGLPAERTHYAINARKDGFAWGQGAFNTNAPKPLALVLDKPASVSGRVSDKQGAPVAGAHVYLSTFKRGPGNTFLSASSLRGVLLSAQTGKDGAFTINDVPEGANIHFTVEAEGYATSNVEVLQSIANLPTAPINDAAITLLPESRISGTLKREKDGTPVAGITLFLHAPRGTPTPPPSPTDAEGRFEARGLAAGDYSITVYPRLRKQTDLGGLVAAMSPIHLGEGETRENVSVTWTEGALLTGKVLNAETKEPVGEVNVMVSSPKPGEAIGAISAITDKSGAYRLRALPGSYNVNLYAQNFARGPGETVTLTSGSQTQDFTIKPLALTKLTVVDEEGKPVAKATVMHYSQILATTDEKGLASFSFDLSVYGIMVTRFIVSSPSGDLATQLDSMSDDMTVTLKKIATLTGVVKKPDGSPLPGATVQAHWRTERSSSPEGSPATTGADGRYKISGMIAGATYAVQAKAKGYGTNAYWSMKPVTVASGETAEVEPITLAVANAVLFGCVTYADGAPVANAELYVTNIGQNARRTASTDKDGRFRMEEMVAERVSLNGTSADRKHLFNREIAPEEFSNVEIVVYPEFDPNAKAGSNTPAPELKELDWVQGDWKGFAGKRTVLAFVSIKNRPSRAAITAAQAAVTGAKDGSLQAVLVHDATATPDEIKDFLAKNQVTLPVGRVKGEENSGLYAPAFAAYKVAGVPTIVIVSAQGKIEAANVKPSELAAKLENQRK